MIICNTNAVCNGIDLVSSIDKGVFSCYQSGVYKLGFLSAHLEKKIGLFKTEYDKEATS